MTALLPTDPEHYVIAIRASGLSIYDPVAVDDPLLWIPLPELQTLLNAGLRGLSLAGLPLRTRSKIVKSHICEALGYPAPASFRKTQPRFPGQMFDTYIQKSNNLQIWNEELSASRRYAIIRVSEADTITQVKVTTGRALTLLDTTGTLTSKYQARCIPSTQATELVTKHDTERLQPFVKSSVDLASIATPVVPPAAGEILAIDAIYERLKSLVGRQFADAGADQERNRGSMLHHLVCEALGYRVYRDDGQFPDVRQQLLEVKLQTSPTIDLGLVTPESIEPLDVPMIGDQQIRHCDVRYAVFYGATAHGTVTLTHFFLTTGAAFFTRFPQFQGRVSNSKLQIPLPVDFFDS